MSTQEEMLSEDKELMDIFMKYFKLYLQTDNENFVYGFTKEKAKLFENRKKSNMFTFSDPIEKMFCSVSNQNGENDYNDMMISFGREGAFESAIDGAVSKASQSSELFAV